MKLLNNISYLGTYEYRKGNFLIEVFDDGRDYIAYLYSPTSLVKAYITCQTKGSAYMDTLDDFLAYIKHHLDTTKMCQNFIEAYDITPTPRQFL